MWSVLVVATVLVWTVRSCAAFNVLPKSALVYTPPDSGGGMVAARDQDHFGYSVAVVRAARNKLWMVVSAPGAHSPLEDRYTRPGALFSCDTQPKDTPMCEQIRLEQGAVQGDARGVDPLIVSNGSLGSAMDAIPSDDGLLVCNHAYKHLYNANKRLDMPGQCYWMKDVRSYKPLKSLIPNEKQGQKSRVQVDGLLYEDDIGTQMMGFSGHEIRTNGKVVEIILGSPGYFWGRGAVVQMNISSPEDTDGGYIEDKTSWGVAIPQLRNDSYFGYSVTSGKFLPGGGLAFAAGAPRGDIDDLKGRVVVFTMKQDGYEKEFRQVNILAVLNGSQIGEYFGAAICAVDLNSDGVDDLLVGAPLHKSSRNEGDEGKVYVFLSNGKSGVNFTLVEPGLEAGGNKTTGARFGTAISALGDINKDGYPDVVVGAPYEEDRGAVYVYYGGPTAPFLLRPQRIFAEDVRNTLRGFGFSLSRAAIDDSYGGTVFAVGAYLSNEAVILRTSPVLKLNSSVEINPALGGKIAMDAANATVKVCVFRGELFRNVGVEVSVLLDPDLNRATFSGGSKLSKYNQTLTQDGRTDYYCKMFDLDIKTLNKNFKPLGVQISFAIVYPLQESGISFCKTCPVLDPENMNHQHQLYFATGCQGHVCKTDFEVKADFDHSQSYLTIGTKPAIELMVHVVNHGESSYETNVTISFPSGVHLKMIPQSCRKDPTKDAQIATLQCEPPYFMNQNKVYDVRLTFEMDSVPWSLDRLTVNVTVEGDGEEITPQNNRVALSLDLLHSALVYIKGRSSPESLEIVAKRNDSDDIVYQDKVFEHSFTVINEGPSPVHDLQVKFQFPYKMKTGVTEITYLNVEAKKPFDVASIASDDVISESNPTHENYEDSSYLILDCSNPKVECLTEYFVYSKTLDKNSGVTFSFKVTGLFKEQGPLLNKGVVLVRTSGSILNEDLHNQELNVPNKPLSTSIETLLHGRIPKGEVQSWIIVVAVICGILILLGLVVILWKYGFFRRNKPPTGDEVEANGKPPTGEKVDTDPLCDGTP